MRRILMILLLANLVPASAQAQRSFRYSCFLSGVTSTAEELPFWAVANQRGIVPEGSAALVGMAFDSPTVPSRGVQWAYGCAVVAYVSVGRNGVVVDQCYVSPSWRKLHLDVGMRAPQSRFGGLATSNGNIVLSGNARNFLGYNFRSDYMEVPFCREKLFVKFNFADFIMLDDRHVEDVRLHNQSLFLKVMLSPRLSLQIGLEDWAQWAGTSPENGPQPSSFRDYLRVITGHSGGSGATTSDQINVLGNHLGRELLAIAYRTERYTLVFQHDIPYEDGSGMGLQNFPDGINTLYWASNSSRSWLTAFLYEFHYTKCQSGRYHDRPATPSEMEKQDPSDPFYGRKVMGGNDNYFNNGEYRSGWTYYGRTVGCPLFIPALPDENGVTHGVASNRYVAHHLALQGYLFRQIPYVLKVTYSRNYGKYNQTDDRFTSSPRQLSLALEGKLSSSLFPVSWHVPIQVHWGLYADLGQLYPSNFGVRFAFVWESIFSRR